MGEPANVPGHLMAPVSPGELVDKMTILEIKQRRLKCQEKRRQVEIEIGALRGVFDRLHRNEARLSGMTANLRQINEELWGIEDEIRVLEHRKNFGASFVGLARRVYLTNDRRAAVKREINALLNASIVEVKEYEDYA